MNHTLHRHTPTLQVCDPSGLLVRSVAYYRHPSQQEIQPRITASATSRAGRMYHSWDPRLFALADTDAPAAHTANLTSLSSLSGRPLLTDSVDAGWRVNLWDQSGQLQASWDGRGTHTRHLYDDLLRPIAVVEQHQQEPERCIGRISYGWQGDPDAVHQNQCGQPIRIDDSAGSRQVQGYSLLGAVLGETRRFLRALTDPDWPLTVAQRDALLETEPGVTTVWTHNALGESLIQTDAHGNMQRSHYDVAGQITGTHLQLSGQSEQTLLSAIDYNAFGQVGSDTAGNGVITTATYRPDDGALLRLVAQRPGEDRLQDLTYDYDPVGNVVRIADATKPIQHNANARIDPVNTFAYDTLYQLIKATGREVNHAGRGPTLPTLLLGPDPTQMANYTQTYDYDAAGNLHKLQHTGAQGYTRHMGTADNSNRSLTEKADGELPSAIEIAEGFDANGNLQTLQPGQTLQWDARNQLCQVTPVVREDGPDDSERYVYDGGGQRLRKVRTTKAKNVTNIAEVRYLPGLEIRTDSATGETLHVISIARAGRSSVRVLHWVLKKPDGVRNDQLRYSLSDHLGSGTLELDEQAKLLSQEGYYPYGGTAWWAAKSQIDAKYKTVRYSGKERDASGLYYYGYRYYAPWLQRWINPDPAGAADGINLYRMVRNNPLTYSDHEGLSSGWFIYENDQERELEPEALKVLLSDGMPKIIFSGDGHNSPPFDYAGDMPDVVEASKKGHLNLYVEVTDDEAKKNVENFMPKFLAEKKVLFRNVFSKKPKLVGWEPENMVSWTKKLHELELDHRVGGQAMSATVVEEFKTLRSAIVGEIHISNESLALKFYDEITNLADSGTFDVNASKKVGDLAAATWRDEYINPYLADKIAQAASIKGNDTYLVSVGGAHLDENASMAVGYKSVQRHLENSRSTYHFPHAIIYNKQKNPKIQRH